MLIALIAAVGVSAGAQVSGDVDYRMDPDASGGFSSDAGGGLDGGDLGFVIGGDTAVPGDDARVDTRVDDLVGPPPTYGGDGDGSEGTTVSAPLPVSGSLGAVGLAVLAARRRRPR